MAPNWAYENPWHNIYCRYSEELSHLSTKTSLNRYLRKKSGPIIYSFRSHRQLSCYTYMASLQAVRYNSNRAAITRLNNKYYVRLYPTVLVQPDGSTVSIRHTVPRRIIKVRPKEKYALFQVMSKIFRVCSVGRQTFFYKSFFEWKKYENLKNSRK